MRGLSVSFTRRLVGVVLFAVLALVGGVAATASAQEVEEVLDDLDNFGYWVEPGADVDIGRLEEVLARQPSLYVVVLNGDADPAVMEDLAFELNDLLAEPGHVVVVSDNAFVATSVSGDDIADQAIEIVDNEVYGSSGAGAPPVETGSTTATAQEEDSGGGGGGFGLLIVLVVIAAIVIGLFLLVRNRNKKTDDSDTVTAKNEIRAQLTVVAQQIFEHEDAVNLSDNEQAIEYYRQANATYAQVSEKLETTDNLLELAELNDRIDLARWQMEAAEALMEGRPVPPEPEPDKPAACFFDPTHHPGTEEATLRTSAGNKDVLVCRSCRDELERGQVPDSRMIDVRGKKVPYAKAPRSHGGGGMGGLGIFEVIVGGLGAVIAGGGLGGGGRGTPQHPRRAPAPQRTAPRDPGRGLDVDWGGGLGGRRQRRSGGTFGPDLTPSPRTRRKRSRTRKSKGSARRSR